MSIPGPVRVAAVGLLGLVLAAALAFAVSRLAAQHIGLSSEPLSAGDRLIPAAARHRTGTAKHTQRRNTTTQRTAPAPATAAPPAAPAAAAPPVSSVPEPVSAQPQPGSRPASGDTSEGGGRSDADD